MSEARQREEIRGTKQWLRKRGFESGARFLVWPYNEASVTSLAVASEYHHFGFGKGYAPSATRLTDPLTISRVDGSNVEKVKEAVDLGEKYDKIVPVMFHSVSNDSGGISVRNFERLLNYIDGTSLDVITASDWLETLRE